MCWDLDSVKGLKKLSFVLPQPKKVWACDTHNTQHHEAHGGGGGGVEGGGEGAWCCGTFSKDE